MRRGYSQRGLYLSSADSNVITQNEHVLTNTDSFVFLAGAANVGKVNVVGFSTKKEMEVFIWCTLDWAPMHSFAPRYFSYHHNNITPPCHWSTVHILSSLIGGSLTRQLFLLIVFNFTIFHFHWVSWNVSLKACDTRDEGGGRVSIFPFPSRWYQPGLHRSTLPAPPET